MTCSRCGVLVNPDAKFCPACGQARRVDAGVVAPTASQQTGQEHMEALRQQIADSLAKARAQQRIIKRRHVTYSMTTIITSGVGALVAGLATILNQPLANDWRVTCGTAAVLGLATTIVAGLQQNHASADLLTEVNTCVARLRALQIDTIALNYDLAAVKQQYQQIVAEATRVDC